MKEGPGALPGPSRFGAKGGPFLPSSPEGGWGRGGRRSALGCPLRGELRDVLLHELALALLVERRLDEPPGSFDGEVRHLPLQLCERLRLLVLDLLAEIGR